MSFEQGFENGETKEHALLVKSLGVSNFTAQALLHLYPFVAVPPTVNQI